ncbi:hypothetical protein N9J72_02210 [Candidatus Gracilibacteria bacterium]|nr:hypothetical protein [Candidatus Gracilibacteria bacterium]
MKNSIVKTLGGVVGILSILVSQTSASFMYQEIDPICSLTGTTHTSFPGEISDTSSWNIPTAYEGECDMTPELSESEEEKIFQIMNDFFRNNDLYGELYTEDVNSQSQVLNTTGQDFVQNVFFPNVSNYINAERAKVNPNTKNIAVLNYAVKTIGYDYFVSQ